MHKQRLAMIFALTCSVFALSISIPALAQFTSPQSAPDNSTPPSTNQPSQQQQSVPTNEVLNQQTGAADSGALRPSSEALRPSYVQPDSNLRQQEIIQNPDRYTQRQTTRVQQADTPTQLSEFQRLVAASTGRVLPIYGAKFFTNAPTTFAPVTHIPVTPEYVIGPGDELLIRIWGQVTLDGHFTVDRSGAIYIPHIGTVQVSGIPVAKLRDYLKSQIGRNYKNFDLNVNLGQLRSIEIFIVGHAKQPGSYTISSLSTLVNAIFASGGPDTVGSMRNIQVRRGEKTISTFDLYDFLLNGDKSKDIPLLSGDVVYIPPVGPMVAVAGAIDEPALYELRNETDIKQVISLAGGFATLAQSNNIRIERLRPEDNTRSVLDVKYDDTGLTTSIRDGDIIEVIPIIDRFKDAVTLRGNVADPRRFAWKPSMHVRDLIPDKEALLTRNYWHELNQLGEPILDSDQGVRRYAPEAPFAEVNGSGISPSPASSTVALPNAHDSDRNVYGLRQDSSNDDVSNRSQMQPNQAGQLNQSSQLNSTEQTGVSGSRTTPSNQNQDSSNTNGNNLSRGSLGAAVTGTARRFPIKNSVLLNAPDIDWAYAVIERVDKTTLETHLLPFNLGRAVIDGDPSQNLELLPGDVITVFSKADIRVPQAQQTKFVRLEGEFSAAGIYSVKPGETLRQLVARAGGLTSAAYLYGSEFTRESAKVIQQQRLLEYADDLDQRIKFAQANSAANVTNPQDELADMNALQNARTAAARLRQLQVSGRIVLSIKPAASSLEDIPELPLEDGDTFIVPPVPATVGVYGSVYDQNSFMYDSQKRTGNYIQLAGGGTRTADVGRSYIIRADGSVVSRQFSGARLTGSFESRRLYPGDAIVVPEQIGKRPMIRNLVDIATIIGQLGLGIAAIQVLK